MSHRYQNIIKPIKIGNVILKNRLIASKIVSQELQATENFPAESTIHFTSSLAKNGAAIVTCAVGNFPEKDGSRSIMSVLHMDDRRVQSYFNKMIDRIHAYGSLASAGMMGAIPMGAVISDVRDKSLYPPEYKPGGRPGAVANPEMTTEEIKRFIDDFTWQCVAMKTIGFDMINVHMSYGSSILAKSLSPFINQRVDEYGSADPGIGGLENRARLTLELFKSVKQACGQDFLIEAQISPIEGYAGGYDMEQFMAYCMMCEGLVDIFHLRHFSGAYHHVSPYISDSKNPWTLQYAAEMKKRGIKSVVAPSGGFFEPEYIEDALDRGLCDMVVLGRPFICDPEYGRKIYLEKGDDIVPCIKCDKCHGAVCSVNPKNGLGHVFGGMFSEPEGKRKVAVIGGGPGGMQAALTAAERGHDVTLFEQNNYLGGQMHHADFMSFKREMRLFKDYLIRKMAQNGVDVRLGVKATKDAIAAGAYDVIIAACGSVPAKSDLKGVQYAVRAVDTYGNESKLGNKVVVVGGALIGSETALHLANCGHEVTVLCRQSKLAYDSTAHGKETLIDIINSYESITALTNCTTTEIGQGFVLYEDKQGQKHKLDCDSVVFTGGREALFDECFIFAGLSPQYFTVGDCNLQTNFLYATHELPKENKAKITEGDVRHAVFSGYMAAYSIV